MSVNTTNVINTFTGDGTTTTFAFTMALQEASDLVVYLSGVKQNGGYTVVPSALAYPTVGGNVVFTTAPTTGTVGTIVRNVPITQSTTLPIDGTYNEQTLVNAFDKAIMIHQQLNAFSLQLSPFCTPRTIQSLAGGYLQFDSTGTFVQSVAGPISTVTFATGGSNLLSAVNSGGTATIDVAAIAAGTILLNATNASAKPTAFAVAADHIVRGAHSGGGIESTTVTGSGGVSVTHTTNNINVTLTGGALRVGTATFSSAGSVDVTDTATTANSIIVVTEEGTGASDRYSVARSAGSKFTIYSSNNTSTKKVDYIAIG